jgi:hypothetical protein
MSIGLMIFLALATACVLFGGAGQSYNENVSLDTHRVHGRYRVLYNDGFLSQPFMPQIAKFYAEHFGGKVVARNYNGPHRVRCGKWVNVSKSAAYR